MRMSLYQRGIVVMATLFLIGSGAVFAAETPAKATNMDISLTAEPARYTFVNGDSSKFRALHWMDDGFAFGAKDFKFKTELQDNVTIESEGHAIPEDGDYSGSVHLTKEDFGYINFDYDGFRKYYSNAGGFYSLHDIGFSSAYTDKELALDIGKFGFEAGLTMKNLPETVVSYEREFKEGTKSSTEWGTIYSRAAVQKKISPTWLNLDEITDSFNARMSDTVAGFNWKANQHWEYMRAKDMMEYRTLTAESVAANSTHDEHVDQAHQPRTDLIATTLNLDRWFMKEKVYASSGYRFSQIDSRELFSQIHMQNRDGLPTTTSSSATTTNTLESPSDNHFVSQTGVLSFMTTLFEPLTAITRFKAEATHRQSESTYTNQAINSGAIQNYVSENQEKVMRYGESASLRYSGISWMSIYNDYDLEQFESNLHKNRTTSASATSSDIYDLKNAETTNRASTTLGAQMLPWKHAVLTIQGQHRYYDSNFDHTVAGIAPSTTLIPTWYDGQKVTTEEAQARLSWKPCRWFQPSFRYQLNDRNFETQTLPDRDVTVHTAQISSVYTWDLTSQPVDDLLMTASFSYQDGKVITPTRMDGAFPLPTFDFDVYTSLFTAEYAFTKDLILSGTADYTRAANFNDISAISVPYGADFHMTDLTIGLSWQVKKDFTLEPKYAWYQYSAGTGSDVGSYDANLISLEGKMKW